MAKISFLKHYSVKPSVNKVLFLSLLALIVGCDSKTEPAASGAKMHPAMVSIQTMAPKQVPFSIEFPATLSGAKEVEIRAQVSGILQKRNFSEGSKVQAGQSLFTLDSKLYSAALEKSKADLASAITNLRQSEREVDRLIPLRANNSVSQSKLDDAKSVLEVNVARVESAKADVEQAKLRLEYTRVVSPVTGITGRERVSEGTYVSGPNVLLTNLTQIDPMLIRFGISEREQLQMNRDASEGFLTLPKDGHWDAKIKLFDGSFYPMTGQVNFSDIRINPQTGTSELQATIANPDFELRPGQFVRVILSGATRENAFVVPQRAVLDNPTGKFVYVIAKNKQGMDVAMPAPVVVGEWVKETKDGHIVNGWVIRQGLKAGDKVIVDGMARIFFPGMPVVLGQPNNKAAAH